MILGWPYKHKRIGVASDGKFGRLGPFDKDRYGRPLPHTGSDYRIGCNVLNYSPLDGRVYEVVNGTTGYGKYVRIKLKNGYKVAFAHLNRIDVKKGEIKEGMRIGLVGSTGAGTGCHSHLELRNPSGKLVNPETTIKWRKLDMTKWVKRSSFDRDKKILKTRIVSLLRDKKILKDRIKKDYIPKNTYHKALEQVDKQHSKIVSNLQGEYTKVNRQLEKCKTTKGGGSVGILDGKKTYLVGFGIILMAIGGFLSGTLTLAEAITSGLLGLGFGAVRHGVSQK